MFQIGAHIKSLSTWQKGCKVMKFLPLEAHALLAQHSNSDLHCIMALANENNRSRKTIWAVEKVTSTLRTDEMFKFLPIMMEMIVWKASDEEIDSLIKNIVNKNEDH